MVNGFLRCVAYMLKGGRNQQKRNIRYKHKPTRKLINSHSRNNNREGLLKKTG